jgi:hypothetical protein
MSVNMNTPRAQMMQVLSNPLFNQLQLPQQNQFQQQLQQQQQQQAPRRNSNIHEQLMAQCAQNLMRSTNSALPLSCLSQINSLQQPVAAGMSPLAALQQQHQLQQELRMVNMVPPQQAVPDETFSKETFFEDNTDDDETYSADDYYSGDSYPGESYSGESSDDGMDTRSTNSTLEDDLNDFLSEFDTNKVLFT